MWGGLICVNFQAPQIFSKTQRPLSCPLDPHETPSDLQIYSPYQCEEPLLHGRQGSFHRQEQEPDLPALKPENWFLPPKMLHGFFTLPTFRPFSAILLMTSSIQRLIGTKQGLYSNSYRMQLAFNLYPKTAANFVGKRIDTPHTWCLQDIFSFCKFPQKPFRAR